MFCVFGSNWFCYFSGSFIEVLFPSILYLFSLRLRGGLFLSPGLLYWIATALYSAGVYASDGAANRFSLVASDMVSDSAAGVMKGDWYYILQPFKALDYAEKVGMIFEICACIVLALAVYSIIEYVRRLLFEGLSDPI
ncbi:MAG: hypothetical protein K6E94_01180 [Elusimicrobiaceae bacterium]|nr:hypothetical protein [Elusimicrobiaceae bacterium]